MFIVCKISSVTLIFKKGNQDFFLNHQIVRYLQLNSLLEASLYFFRGIQYELQVVLIL